MVLTFTFGRDIPTFIGREPSPIKSEIHMNQGILEQFLAALNKNNALLEVNNSLLAAITSKSAAPAASAPAASAPAANVANVAAVEAEEEAKPRTRGRPAKADAKTEVKAEEAAPVKKAPSISTEELKAVLASFTAIRAGETEEAGKNRLEYLKVVFSNFGLKSPKDVADVKQALRIIYLTLEHARGNNVSPNIVPNNDQNREAYSLVEAVRPVANDEAKYLALGIYDQYFPEVSADETAEEAAEDDDFFG